MYCTSRCKNILDAIEDHVLVINIAVIVRYKKFSISIKLAKHISSAIKLNVSFPLGMYMHVNKKNSTSLTSVPQKLAPKNKRIFINFFALTFSLLKVL